MQISLMFSFYLLLDAFRCIFQVTVQLSHICSEHILPQVLSQTIVIVSLSSVSSRSLEAHVLVQLYLLYLDLGGRCFVLKLFMVPFLLWELHYLSVQSGLKFLLAVT